MRAASSPSLNLHVMDGTALEGTILVLPVAKTYIPNAVCLIGGFGRQPSTTLVVIDAGLFLLPRFVDLLKLETIVNSHLAQPITTINRAHFLMRIEFRAVQIATALLMPIVEQLLQLLLFPSEVFTNLWIAQVSIRLALGLLDRRAGL